MKNVPLELNTYDPFIDYLKGISILFVVLTHCLPLQKYMLFTLWGGQAVPLFLLIQVFHFYKKGMDNIPRVYDYRRLFRRIIKPFLILICIQLMLKFSFSTYSLENTLQILKSTIKSGGMGPGSYYIWIYIQFFFLLPFFVLVFKRFGGLKLCLFFILLSQLVEWICVAIDIPEWIYRLLFLRYIFLVYLGYLWVINKGVYITAKTLFLSFVGVGTIIIFCYSGINFEPLFLDSGWKSCHWPCYFYTAFLFLFLLYKLYAVLNSGIKVFLINLGKYSYDIFLVQMFVFTFMTPDCFSYIGSVSSAYLLYIVVTIILSIAPVIIYKSVKR